MYFTITGGKKDCSFYRGLFIRRFVIHRGCTEPIDWIVIYPLDRAIRRLKNRGQDFEVTNPSYVTSVITDKLLCQRYLTSPKGKSVSNLQGHPTTECFQIRQKCLKWFSLCFRLIRKCQLPLWVRSKLRRHELALLSLGNFIGRFVSTLKVLRDLFSTTIVISWY